MKRDLTVTILALAILAPACGNVGESDPVDGTFSQALSSAEEDGVLRFVNDCQTTQPVLDDDAALDVRAATGIVDRRDGADATCGTADDQPFASIAELDAVPWVGDVALSKLVAQATLLGYVADDDDGLADDYDGVAFSLDEARGVLAIANGASFENLDVDFGLDSRAASAIVAARPFAATTTGANMQELSAASYVGASALQHLKSHAGPWASLRRRGHDREGNRVLEPRRARHAGPAQPGAGRRPDPDLRDRARARRQDRRRAPVRGPDPTRRHRPGSERRWSGTSTTRPARAGARSSAPGAAATRTCRTARPTWRSTRTASTTSWPTDTAWGGERTVDSGSLSPDAGGQVVLTGVQVPDDPDHWQDITVQVFGKLWSCSFQYQYTGDPIELGSNHQGVLRLGRVINAHDGKPYVLAYWQDIDDASLGWLYAKDATGAWVEQGEIFLN